MIIEINFKELAERQGEVLREQVLVRSRGLSKETPSVFPQLPHTIEPECHRVESWTCLSQWSPPPSSLSLSGLPLGRTTTRVGPPPTCSTSPLTRFSTPALPSPPHSSLKASQG